MNTLQKRPKLKCNCIDTDEGRGFVNFYNQNRVVAAGNPLRLYSLQDGNWVEAPE